jgi:hypothetical protein
MKNVLIFLSLLLFSCENFNDKNTEHIFSHDELIINNIYFGYNSEGKAMPFKISVDENNDTTRIYTFDKFYDIFFPENNKSICYINSNSTIPFKISIYDLIKNTDISLMEKIKDHELYFSKYPKEQQIFIYDLIQINDAIITSKQRQEKLQNILKHTKSIVNWKFILKEKKIDALFGISSWIDFMCEGYSFRYKIHSVVDDVFDQNMDDEMHLQRVDSEKNKYRNFEVGKFYTISGKLLKDEYGFGIALDNPISIQIDNIKLGINSTNTTSSSENKSQASNTESFAQANYLIALNGQEVLVADHDFSDLMTWDAAYRACENLGEGWRLPNNQELKACFNQLQNQGEGDFYQGGGDDLISEYWSFQESGSNEAFFFCFANGILQNTADSNGRDKSERYRVRAVKNI